MKRNRVLPIRETAPVKQAAWTAEQLQATIQEIGIARFVGRISSGVIPSREGHQAVEQYVAQEKSRPLLSKVSHFVLGRTDPYSKQGD